MHSQLPGKVAGNMLVNSDPGDRFSLAAIGGWPSAAGFEDVRKVEASDLASL